MIEKDKPGLSRVLSCTYGRSYSREIPLGFACTHPTMANRAHHAQQSTGLKNGLRVPIFMIRDEEPGIPLPCTYCPLFEPND